MKVIDELLYNAEEMLRLNQLSYKLKHIKLTLSDRWYNNPSRRLERQCRELLEDEKYLLKIIEYLKDLREEV